MTPSVANVFITPAGKVEEIWVHYLSCARQRIKRDLRWTRLSVTNKRISDLFTKDAPITIRCRSGNHELIVNRARFAPRNMRMPKE